MTDFQHRMCEFTCPFDKQPITYINKNSGQNLGNRVWCVRCKTINNPTHLEDFYKLVKKIPVIPLQQQLGLIEQKINTFSQMKQRLIAEIFGKFDSIEQKCREVFKIFQQQYNAFNIDNEGFDIGQLQLLAHFISGDGIQELEKNILELKEQEKLFFDNFSDSLVNLSKRIINRFNIEMIPITSSFLSKKKEWTLFSSAECPADVYALACSSNGKQFIAGGLPMKQYDEESTLLHYFDTYGALRSELYGAHTMTVNHAIMTKDNIIITSSEDKTIREGYKKPGFSHFQFKIYRNDKTLTSLFLDRNEENLLSGQSDGSIVLWKREGVQEDYMTCKAWMPQDTLWNHVESVTLLKMNNESTIIFSGCGTNQLTIWENYLNKWRVKQILQLPETLIIQTLCCLEAGHFLLGTNTGIINLYQLERSKSHFTQRCTFPSFGSAIKEMIYNYNQGVGQLLILTLDKFVILEMIDMERHVEIFKQEGNYSCLCFVQNVSIIAAYQSGKKELQFFKVFEPEMEASKPPTKSFINPSGKSYVESRIVFQK